MSSKRPSILMAILLMLVLGYVSRPYWYPQLAGYPVRPVQAAALPGNNSISGLQVRQDETGAWLAEFDYFYTGEPKFSHFFVALAPKPSSADTLHFPTDNIVAATAQRGSHHVSVEIHHPGGSGLTRQVQVSMRSSMPASAIVSQQIDKTIEWPTWQAWTQDREFAKSSPDELFKRAVTLIDTNKSAQIDSAKIILERLIGRDPRFAPGYIELARVAMKSNWGTEALHHAESLLSSALEIDPSSANAKILLGYVYAHQQRYPKAEALFVDAAATKPKNLWLWANWGELLAMQGKYDQAIAKYRETIGQPIAHDSNDRAREDAYRHLFPLLERRKDLDGMEALYKQRVAEFGSGGCYSADYARFLLQQRGNAQAAIDLATKALGLNCNDGESRQVLGLAHYVAWSQETNDKRSASLNQARIYLPAGPMPLYLLATSDRTVAAAKQLIAAGENIDQKDDEKLNALAYALQRDDLTGARRLLQLGARPDAPVSWQNIPVALMPVMTRNFEAIRLLQQFGADYTKLKYEDATAFEFAKQSGDRELQEALTHKGPIL